MEKLLRATPRWNGAAPPWIPPPPLAELPLDTPLIQGITDMQVDER
jgi:hypothetical protein